MRCMQAMHADGMLVSACAHGQCHNGEEENDKGGPLHPGQTPPAECGMQLQQLNETEDMSQPDKDSPCTTHNFPIALI